MSDSLGLVAGAGALPAVMAREARAAGWRVIVFAFADPGPFAEAADRVRAALRGNANKLLVMDLLMDALAP